MYFQIDDYINSKEKKVTKATLCVFYCMKAQLLAFEEYRKKKISFDSFDYEFYESFIDFLTFEYKQRRRKTIIRGLKVNSIGKTIKRLRIFIRDRTKRKIIQPVDLTDFKIPEEEADAIDLTLEEIGRIYKADLKEFPYLVEYRNLFVLACLTGLRFSDFSILPDEFWTQIRKIIQEEIYKAQKRNPDMSTLTETPGLTEKPLYKISEICSIFNITRPTIYDWEKHGKLRRVKIRSRVYFLGTDVKQLMKP